MLVKITLLSFRLVRLNRAQICRDSCCGVLSLLKSTMYTDDLGLSMLPKEAPPNLQQFFSLLLKQQLRWFGSCYCASHDTKCVCACVCVLFYSSHRRLVCVQFVLTTFSRAEGELSICQLSAPGGWGCGGVCWLAGFEVTSRIETVHHNLVPAANNRNMRK